MLVTGMNYQEENDYTYIAVGVTLLMIFVTAERRPLRSDLITFANEQLSTRVIG